MNISEITQTMPNSVVSNTHYSLEDGAMTENELGQILREMYDTAKRNESACQIHLFGIIYGPKIREQGFASKNIIRLSGISKGYEAELSKGIKLSKYVELRK